MSSNFNNVVKLNQGNDMSDQEKDIVEITDEMYDAAWSAFGATSMEDLHKKLSIHDARRLFKMFVDAINTKT